MEPYQASMHNGKFHPFRRDVNWLEAQTTPIRPLLNVPDFTRGKTNWGYPFRFGLFKISPADMSVIHNAMKP